MDGQESIKSASVDFYLTNFEEDAPTVTVKTGVEYIFNSVIGNICEKVDYNWTITGATPTNLNTKRAFVRFNEPGIYSVTLAIRSREAAGGGLCRSDGSHTKQNYVRVIR